MCSSFIITSYYYLHKPNARFCSQKAKTILVCSKEQVGPVTCIIRGRSLAICIVKHECWGDHMKLRSHLESCHCQRVAINFYQTIRKTIALWLLFHSSIVYTSERSHHVLIPQRTQVILFVYKLSNSSVIYHRSPLTADNPVSCIVSFYHYQYTSLIISYSNNQYFVS